MCPQSAGRREMPAVRWDPQKKSRPDRDGAIPIRDVKPGTRVRTPLGGVEATVVRHSLGSTTVAIHRKRTRSFRTSEGESVSFSKGKKET